MVVTVFAAVGWASVTLAVAGEIPKALFTVSPTNAPKLGTAIERAVASEPTAIAADPNLEKNQNLRLINSYGVCD
jgi:hypothetical protein